MKIGTRVRIAGTNLIGTIIEIIPNAFGGKTITYLVRYYDNVGWLTELSYMSSELEVIWEP